MAPNNEHHHYDTNKYAGDQAADTRRVMNHMPDEDRSTTEEIQQSINQSQATDLTDGVRMGDDRVIGDTPNWDNFESKTLYSFATENNSPTTADDLGRAFNDGGNSLADSANGLFAAVSSLDGAWSGVAADSAKSALAPLAQAAGLAGQTAQLMGVRMSQQSVAAAEVRKLPPAKEFSQEQSLNAMLAGGPVAMQQDLKTQKDAADSVKREQVSYLNTYTQSLSAVDAQTPSFVPPQETITGGPGGTTQVSNSNIHTPTTHAPTTHATTTTTPTNNVKNVPVTHDVGPTGHDSQNTGQTGHPTLPGNTTSAGYTPLSTSAGPSTFGPGGGGGGTSTGGPGAGGFGPGFGGGFGPGGGSGAGAGAGSGANTGSNGPRGMTPGEMSPARAAAGAGRGNSGMGGAPRGKGEGEEDKEHERPSYLVEGDPESTFGNDQLTAPPVIGGDD